MSNSATHTEDAPVRFIIDRLCDSNDLSRLARCVASGTLPAALTGLSAVHKAVAAAALVKRLERSFPLLTPTEADAARLCEDLTALGVRAVLYPARDLNFRARLVSSNEYEYKRLAALWELLNGRADICVCSAEAAAQYTLPPDVLKARAVTLRVSDTVDTADLINKLIASGYTRCEQVEGMGQFAMRGGIFDVFSPNGEYPIRIELFGDEVETISSFDAVSQRRISRLGLAEIIPASEKLFDREGLADAVEAYAARKRVSEKAREVLMTDASAIRSGIAAALDKYITLMYDRPATVFRYTGTSAVIISESTGVDEHFRGAQKILAEDVTALLEAGELAHGLNKFTLDRGELLAETASAVYLETFTKSRYPVSPAAEINVTARSISPWTGSLDALCDELTAPKDWLTVILAGNKKAAANLCSDLSARGLPVTLISASSSPAERGIVVCAGALSAGFEFPSEKFILITAGGKTPVSKPRPRPKNSAEVGSLDELTVGDYVVHAAHGIGVFDGVNKLEVEGVAKDYIKIRYDKGGVLYVPVTQLDLVSKYVGAAEDSGIKLNRLGSGEWRKTRARVGQAVKDLADQLIKLYAKRMATKGFAFSRDTDLQSVFESRFEYEETPDQLRCVNEIKRDMQRPVPMDRLLCGDVGFGKTEVALRAAFKCISEGKQCAFLAPTTILAQQHYETTVKRIGDLPLKVALLSRFRSKAQQDQAIRGIASGRIDMVIGTHRMISKDVQFRDLGLVIIDEEQRFGVSQKERFKELFPGVDVLTLSATPIPRTLNMAISGLRDMSTIEEAPQDRYPVQTYVMEQDNAVIDSAIIKELRRGGQVYYLHNRIESIDACAARLKSRLPDCHIAVAHGRMSEDELSEVWRRLLDHEIDILVCTTIIESGIDVPNVNTMIIEDADRFGLAQLHQLRGRVGRSRRRAYAYVCFRANAALSEIASKRLEAIRQFTEFGSGFKIAMRDLEIRGAGNILGGEQHGHLESVGYDMYLKMLADAVRLAKGEPNEPEAECTVDIRESALIPENYITLLPARMGIYRRIADIRTPADADDVLDELNDRFGSPPPQVKVLVEVSLLRRRAARLCITEVIQKSGRMMFTIEKFSPERLYAISNRFKGRVKLMPGDKPVVAVRLADDERPLEILKTVLDEAEAADR